MRALSSSVAFAAAAAASVAAASPTTGTPDEDHHPSDLVPSPSSKGPLRLRGGRRLQYPVSTTHCYDGFTMSDDTYHQTRPWTVDCSRLDMSTCVRPTANTLTCFPVEMATFEFAQDLCQSGFITRFIDEPDCSWEYECCDEAKH
jgi:hypothetical protein